MKQIYSVAKLRSWPACIVFSLLFACPGAVSGITINIDYTYDDFGFFDSSTTNGLAARNTIEAAATFYSTLLEDTFSAIETPPPFSSQVFNGAVTWSWTAKPTHPSTGLEIQIDNPIVAEDEVRIYAGAYDLLGSVLGRGGPGGFSLASNPSGGFISSEIDQINEITDNFSIAVENRGEVEGFATWGGNASFDTLVNWNYIHTQAPGPTEHDLYSVALHEIGHVLGIGTSSEWINLLVGDPPMFTGTAAMAAFGGPVPASTGHWAEGTESTILATLTTQEAAMDPNIADGTRKIVTLLDASALIDLGWEVTLPDPVPEPTSSLLVTICLLFTCYYRPAK